MSQGFALRFPGADAMTAASLGKLSQSVVQKDKPCATSFRDKAQISIFKSVPQECFNVFMTHSMLVCHGGPQACAKGMYF